MLRARHLHAARHVACQLHAGSRTLSASAATSQLQGAQRAAVQAPAAVDGGGIFSRHGGKMLIGFLGALGGWVYRSSLGTANMNALKQAVEEKSPLAPDEVEDLRCENDLPPSLFVEVVHNVQTEFPDGGATYSDFTDVVAALLPHPLEQAHLLDRGVLGTRLWQATLPGGATKEAGHELGTDHKQTYDTDLLLVAFSMTVNTTVQERMEQLWHLIAAQGGDNTTDVDYASMARLLDLLLATRQLPSSRYAIKSGEKWPTQQYRLASGTDLLENALAELHDDDEKKKKGWIERKLSAPRAQSAASPISYQQFKDILECNCVCAWGECFVGRADRR